MAPKYYRLFLPQGLCTCDYMALNIISSRIWSTSTYDSFGRKKKCYTLREAFSKSHNINHTSVAIAVWGYNHITEPVDSGEKRIVWNVLWHHAQIPRKAEKQAHEGQRLGYMSKNDSNWWCLCRNKNVTEIQWIDVGIYRMRWMDRQIIGR